MSSRAAAAFAVVGGVLLAAQARVNAALATRLGSSVVTAGVSFAIGTAALLAVVVGTGALGRLRMAMPVARPFARHPRQEHREQRWWHLAGGLGGAFLVSVSAAAVPVIGVALLSVCVVAGQSSGGLVVDRLGLSPHGHQHLTRTRLGGAALAVAAVAVAASGHHGVARPLLLAAAAAAGFAVAGQQAANGHLRMHTGRAPVAALVSFAVGTAGLWVLVLALAATGHLPGLHWPTLWWLYLGGLGGAAYIALASAAVPVIGVLRLTLASVAGQIAGGLLLDLVTPTGHALEGRTVAGAALLLVSVAVTGRRAAVVRASGLSERPARREGTGW